MKKTRSKNGTIKLPYTLSVISIMYENPTAAAPVPSADAHACIVSF